MNAFPVMPAANVRGPNDLFDCGPYRCRLRALACAKRQSMVRKGAMKTEYARCRSCEDGELVARIVGPVTLGKHVDATERSIFRGGKRASIFKDQNRAMRALEESDDK